MEEKSTVAKDVAINIGGKIAMVGTAIGGIIFGINYFLNSDDRAQKELLKQKVKVSLVNLPQYSFATVKEYALKPKNELIHLFGGNWDLPRITYNSMVSNKIKIIYWTPDKLVKELYAAMKGTNFPFSATTILAALNPLTLAASLIYDTINSSESSDPREIAWGKLLKLNKDQLRLLHNYWIDHAAEGNSFYSWVDAEWNSSSVKQQLMAKLNSAGVGQYVIKDRNKV